MKARHPRAILPFIGVLMLAASCSSEQSTEPLSLAYKPDDRLAATPFTLTSCHFGGPQQTVALVTQTSPLDEPTSDTLCETPYADVTATAVYQVERVAAGSTPGAQLTVVMEDAIWAGDHHPHVVGSTHLVSMRESGGAWFVDRIIPVEILPGGDPQSPSGTGATDRAQVDLPTDWATLASEMKNLSNNYVVECSPDGKTRQLYDDQEYYDYRYGSPEGCDGDVEAPPSSADDAGSEIGKTTSDAPDGGT